MTALAELARPFPKKYVKTKPGKSRAAYVEHSDVTQRLLEVVGPFTQEIVRVIQGDVPSKVDKDTGEVKNEALLDAVTGVVLRLTVEIDGRTVSVEEVGEVEHPHNHTTDASRLKFATSDAIKRCAMRLGLGLHLWCQDHYYLHTSLAKRTAQITEGTAVA